MDFHVDVGQYAGPLDLLLFLVKREEIDLSTIRLAKLTEQFRSYIEVLVEINVDDVGEFLEMASVLIELKSKLLLPTESKADESDEVVLEDPADQLVQRLVQYKRYRDAASLLDEQSRRWQLRYSRLANDLPTRRNTADEQPIADLEIWDLVSAFGRILRENRQVASTTVVYDDTPIHVHMQRIHQRILDQGEIELQSLFEIRAHKSTLVAMFLATLELTRHHGVVAIQRQATGPIYIGRGPAFQEDLSVHEVHNLDNSAIDRSNLPIRPR